MTTNILLAAALWLFACAFSVAAILFVFLGRTRHLWLPGLLGFTGAVIGGMGYSSWTPFGYFPEIAYTWSSDTFEFHIRSGWLFVAPLVVGGVAALLALRKLGRSRHAA